MADDIVEYIKMFSKSIRTTVKRTNIVEMCVVYELLWILYFFPGAIFKFKMAGPKPKILVGATSGFHQEGLNMHSAKFHALVTKCIVLALYGLYISPYGYLGTLID